MLVPKFEDRCLPHVHQTLTSDTESSLPFAEGGSVEGTATSLSFFVPETLMSNRSKQCASLSQNARLKEYIRRLSSKAET